jgi:large subunit ribosomal protein L25
MSTVELNAMPRTGTGTGSARKTRMEGLIPAVLYGEGEEPKSLTVNYKEFYSVIHTTAGENVILDLTVEGSGGACKAIVREIQYHPVRRDILHVDFQHISMTKEITVDVHIEVEGIPEGVTTKGGILELILREVEVECLPANIPDKIVVDVTELDVGDSLQVKDLQISEGRIVTDPDSTVVTIVAPTVVEEKKVEVEEAEGEEEKPAEEGEVKKDEKAEGGDAKAEK